MAKCNTIEITRRVLPLKKDEVEPIIEITIKRRCLASSLKEEKDDEEMYVVMNDNGVTKTKKMGIREVFDLLAYNKRTEDALEGWQEQMPESKSLEKVRKIKVVVGSPSIPK